MRDTHAVRQALKTAGIDDFDKLVEAVAETAGTLAVPPSEPEAAPTQYDHPGGEEIIHRWPAVPLVVDGRLLQKAEELEEFNGRPLHYIPIRQKGAIVLAAYTSVAPLFDKARLRGGLIGDLFGLANSNSEHICQQPPDSLPDQVCFFEHINEEGDVVCLSGGRAYRDLTNVGRAKVLWSYTADWNDVVSSVSWCRWDVTLFEHVNYGGSRLDLAAGCNTPNLVDFGWNDRASSLVNWGRRF